MKKLQKKKVRNKELSFIQHVMRTNISFASINFEIGSGSHFRKTEEIKKYQLLRDKKSV